MGRLCREAEIRIVRLGTLRISRSEKARTLLFRYEPAAALAGALSTRSIRRNGHCEELVLLGFVHEVMPIAGRKIGERRT